MMASEEQDLASVEMSISPDELIAILRDRIAIKSASSATTLPQALFPLSANEFEPLECYPWRRENNCNDAIELRELVNATGDRIVQRLYHILLQREPSSEESTSAMTMLANGCSPTELAIRLRLSKEGRKIGIRVGGIEVGLGREVVNFVARRVFGQRGNRT
jgi:hypothetical protein